MGERITDLTETESVDDNDLLTFVDVSDTLYSVNGTNKKVKKSNLIKDLTVDNLASGVLDTDLSSVSGNDDTIPSAKATKAFIDSLTNGWIPAEETWTYASSTTFTISGDKTGKYQKGDKIKLTQTSVKYFYIIGVSYSSNNTTITVTGGSDYSLANATITKPYFSKAENPQGFPHWFSYTASVGGFSTPPTMITRFCLKGTSCILNFVSTTNGTSNSTGFTISLPITAKTISNYSWRAQILAVDNGNFANNGTSYIESGIAVARLYINGANNWTPSGNKSANGQITYEI